MSHSGMADKSASRAKSLAIELTHTTKYQTQCPIVVKLTMFSISRNT